MQPAPSGTEWLHQLHVHVFVLQEHTLQTSTQQGRACMSFQLLPFVELAKAAEANSRCTDLPEHVISWVQAQSLCDR